MVESFIKMSLADLRGSEIVYAALPGEALLSEEGKQAAERLAKALVEGPSEREGDSKAPRCNLCGGDTFRSLENGNVRCMLCSSEGSYGWQNDALHVTTTPGDHPLFLTYDDTKNHYEFLRGMKDKFMANKKALKAAAQDCHDVGEWIRPPKE